VTVSPASAHEAARVRAVLASLIAAYRLDLDVIAAGTGVPVETLERVQAGLTSPGEDRARRIDQFAAAMAHNSLDAWKARISASSGYELLVDRTLTILAVNGTNQALRGRTVQGTLDPSLFVGRTYNSILPSLDCALIETHGNGIDDLVPLGFFEGRVRCVRFCAEINAGPVTCVGVREFWPVETADAGIVAHAVLHDRYDVPKVLKLPGIYVHWREVVRAGS
jgi:hypothetical protein